jgi:hypothetical protein
MCRRILYGLAGVVIVVLIIYFILAAVCGWDVKCGGKS